MLHSIDMSILGHVFRHQGFYIIFIPIFFQSICFQVRDVLKKIPFLCMPLLFLLPLLPCFYNINFMIDAFNTLILHPVSIISALNAFRYLLILLSMYLDFLSWLFLGYALLVICILIGLWWLTMFILSLLGYSYFI